MIHSSFFTHIKKETILPSLDIGVQLPNNVICNSLFSSHLTQFSRFHPSYALHNYAQVTLFHTLSNLLFTQISSNNPSPSLNYSYQPLLSYPLLVCLFNSTCSAFQSYLVNDYQTENLSIYIEIDKKDVQCAIHGEKIKCDMILFLIHMLIEWNQRLLISSS